MSKSKAGIKPTGKKSNRRKYNSKFDRLFTTHSPFKLVENKTLEYVSTGFLNAHAGDNTVFGTGVRFSLNSIFQPNMTSADTQPIGYDQMALIYKRYKCKKAHVRLEINDPTDDGTLVAYRVINPSNLASGISALVGQTFDYVEASPQSNIMELNNTGSQTKVISFSAPMHKLAGVTKLQFDADPDNYTAGIAGNPGNQCALEIAAGNLRTSTGPPSVAYKLTIKYDTQFYQRDQLPQSA